MACANTVTCGRRLCITTSETSWAWSPRKTGASLNKVEDGQLVGLNANYVEDLLRAGRTEFRGRYCETHAMFEMSKENDVLCDFTGLKTSWRQEKIF